MVDREGWRLYDTEIGPLKVYVHPCVYTPSDDSLLAIRVIDEARRLVPEATRVLDMGTGTGILAKALLTVYPNAYAVVTDVNPYALESAKLTLEGTDSVVVACRWAFCLEKMFDITVLNPPYLPVEDELRNCPFLSKAWSGSPIMLEEACIDAARVSKSLILVYSSLSGWNPLECLESRGFKAVITREVSFFMERIYAVFAVRGDMLG